MPRRRLLALATAAAACQTATNTPFTPVTDCEIDDRDGTPTGERLIGLDAFMEGSSCAMTPDDQLGPYYVCDDFRQSIAEDRPGAALRVGLRVVGPDCEPIPGAVVDLWHCDAGGYYSGVDADPDLEAGSEPVSRTETRFCRGSQTSDADGVVEFETIFPGWYAGRTTHLHVRVYLPDGRTFVTQTYFEESVRSTMYSMAPYDAERAARFPLNADEDIEAGKVMTIGVVDGRSTATLTLSV